MNNELIAIVIGFVLLTIVLVFFIQNLFNSFFNSVNSKLDKMLSLTDELNHTLRKLQEVMENTKPVIHNFYDITNNVRKITNNVSEITNDVSFITKKGRSLIETVQSFSNNSITQIALYVKKILSSSKEKETQKDKNQPTEKN